MKKVIRLTESELTRLLERIIDEQNKYYNQPIDQDFEDLDDEEEFERSRGKKYKAPTKQKSTKKEFDTDSNRGDKFNKKSKHKNLNINEDVITDLVKKIIKEQNYTFEPATAPTASTTAISQPQKQMATNTILKPGTLFYDLTTNNALITKDGKTIYKGPYTFAFINKNQGKEFLTKNNALIKRGETVPIDFNVYKIKPNIQQLA